MGFPENFVWGVASSAYQIEGAVKEGGRGASIWDTFSHRPGAVFNNQNGDVACDHYHRCAEDIELMARLGVSHYRFSISWPRIFPLGRGAANPDGLAFYDKLVDLCLARGMTPLPTLFHWDLPQALEEEGGWLNAATAEAFADYAGVVATHFKGRVKQIITLNEPQCFVHLGYGQGQHAPGKQLGLGRQLAVMHQLLRAHGLALRAIRKKAPAMQVGVASTGTLCYAEPDTPENRAAAEGFCFTTQPENPLFSHQWVLDPIVLGRWPGDGPPELQTAARAVPREDMEAISEPIDFIGLNVYNGAGVCRGADGQPRWADRYDGFPRTSMKWPVTPEVMRHPIVFLHRRYGLPLYITENGQSCNDRVFRDGKVHDPDRIDTLHRYLAALAGAVEDGADVRGYFHWSFTDNFEWNSGYEDRFGLVYVDYPTQRRIPKDSFFWYADVVKNNGKNL